MALTQEEIKAARSATYYERYGWGDSTTGAL